MRLNDPLYDSFEFDGVVYPLDLSFNKVLDTFDCLRDDLLSDLDKVQSCVGIITGNFDVEFSLAIDLWLHIRKNFIDSQEDDEVQYDRQGNPMPQIKNEETGPRLMDLEKDAEYIYASFLQAYGINLLKVQNQLSWQEFKALLNSLPDNTVMQQIVQIRAWKPSSGESSDYRQKMRQLQAKYRLDDGEEEEDGS
ncbi:Gp15 family bacteriophage protein [Streptococcus suis]|uniref:Gp15 family bacteriophage protein n=1 Tax=Streptococcus suis TaxID=1307 RepID=UPI002FC62E5B